MVTDTVKSVMGICDGWGIYQITITSRLGRKESHTRCGYDFFAYK